MIEKLIQNDEQESEQKFRMKTTKIHIQNANKMFQIKSIPHFADNLLTNG